MKTAVEKIIEEIDNEVDFLKRYEYISEVHGRMIGLAFAKRVALELKELEKEQIGDAYEKGFNQGYRDPEFLNTNDSDDE